MNAAFIAGSVAKLIAGLSVRVRARRPRRTIQSKRAGSWLLPFAGLVVGPRGGLARIAAAAMASPLSACGMSKRLRAACGGWSKSDALGHRVAWLRMACVIVRCSVRPRFPFEYRARGSDRSWMPRLCATCWKCLAEQRGDRRQGRFLLNADFGGAGTEMGFTDCLLDDFARRASRVIELRSWGNRHRRALRVREDYRERCWRRFRVASGLDRCRGRSQ